MRILYGIQGTGNGHLARARALAPALQRAGIDCDFVFSGRRREDFFNMESFGEDFRCFAGLTFATGRGRLQTGKTLVQNNLARFLNDVRRLALDDYDLVLSDFEPVTAWAARLRGKPSLGISHQCAFDYPVPKVPGYLSARLVMKSFAPTRYRIGLHWHHFGQPVLPPLIERQHAAPVVDNKIVVYMGFERLDDIVRLLQLFSHWQFVIYSKDVPAPQQIGHLRLEPLSHEGFHRDLADCAGVISNAGFELASECLQLGKKLLVKPLHGQYEQLCNAHALELLQRGHVMHSLDSEKVAAWLAAPPPEAMPFADIADVLAHWIRRGEYHDIDPLLATLWPDRQQATATIAAVTQTQVD
ncbi:MAG TPA: MJ1255/VC2487 family glycosyltransferase [Pseudomonadales bacterium]